MITDEDRKKALLSPNIGKHGKRKSTLLKDEMRKKFIEYFGVRFDGILEKLNEAIASGNMPATFEVLHQLIGTADNNLIPDETGVPSKEAMELAKEFDEYFYQKLKRIKT
jgi:hypothetical protein